MAKYPLNMEGMMHPFMGTGKVAIIALAGALLVGCGDDDKTKIIRQGGDPPGTPTNVVATAVGSGSIMIDWAIEPVATSYRLYWDTSPGVTKASGTPMPVQDPPYVHSCVENGTPCYYVVSAVNPFGESAISNEATATPQNWGILDRSFGTNGWVVYDSGGLSTGGDRGESVALDNSRRVLVTGGTPNSAGDSDMIAWRYNEDGSLDSTFGAFGVVIHDNAAGGGGNDSGKDIVLDSAGRILVTGESRGPSGPAMTLWRYDEAGLLDSTFGSGGTVTAIGAAGGQADYGWGIVIDTSERILVAGSSANLAGDSDMAIWRYEQDGVPDTTFGAGGVVTHGNAAGGDSGDLAHDIAVDSSGRILATGHSNGGPVTMDDMVVWCYDASGNLDNTFGTGGFVLGDSPGTGGNQNDVGFGILVEPSGRIVVGGRSQDLGNVTGMALWAYDSMGNADAGFGTGGVVWAANPPGLTSSTGYDVGRDSVGRIYVAGIAAPAVGNGMGVWRFDSSGNDDASFAQGGFYGLSDSVGFGLAVDECDRLLVTGETLVATEDMAIWRFH